MVCMKAGRAGDNVRTNKDNCIRSGEIMMIYFHL